jgi:hypothetical protein
LQVLDSAFEDHNIGTIKKELVRVEEKLKDQTLWADSADHHKRYQELEKLHGELLNRQETMWQ